MEDGDPIRFLGYRGVIKSTPSHYFKGLALCPSLVATSEAHNVNKLTKGSQRIQLQGDAVSDANTDADTDSDPGERQIQIQTQLRMRMQIRGRISFLRRFWAVAQR